MPHRLERAAGKGSYADDACDEWGSFKPRFGLVHVDFETFKRTLKPSAHLYRGIIESHGLTEALLDRYIRPLLDIKVYPPKS